ncbi:hypothetical protein TNIN_281251 [Trichonephila inaurata madagascariensis]|uniref:Uncharacterized protein n=1 Tax=Trichonephila inaurata madagascariensis TaxID=2747483 RepID=A0A8X6X8S3_9ARAC|nr:hypothetical protein TNIN_421481 [Trichonephila inaurata madagascariensis]GFY77425.1 hypothetical protein TNIN_281241 [Trichonephila inaurata madagascariensis]GFY77426.1 hypothetical protein TNIN_281251 [Trichonephila inaurata madagascariensis]
MPQHLMSLNIYGKGKPIKKEECINHIPQAPRTGLRSKVKEWAVRACIGGKKVRVKMQNESLHSVMPGVTAQKKSFPIKEKTVPFVVTAKLGEFNFDLCLPFETCTSECFITPRCKSVK